jgi:type II secretion system protein J
MILRIPNCGEFCRGNSVPDVSRGKGSRRAFTLIEVLIAIGIFGLVMLAIYSSWMAVLRGSKAGLDAAREAQRLRVSMQVIKESLVSVRMFTANAELYAFEADTSGDTAALSFVSSLARSFPRSGRFGDLNVRRVTYTVEPGPGGTNRLVMRQLPLLLEMDIDEEENPLVLARDVKLFQLEFWDEMEQDWFDEWTYTNQLPKMVKVTLGLGQSQRAASEPNRLITEIIGLPATAIGEESQRLRNAPGGNQGGYNANPINLQRPQPQRPQ